MLLMLIKIMRSRSLCVKNDIYLLIGEGAGLSQTCRVLPTYFDFVLFFFHLDDSFACVATVETQFFSFQFNRATIILVFAVVGYVICYSPTYNCKFLKQNKKFN
jgi:hypothetical protein